MFIEPGVAESEPRNAPRNSENLLEPDRSGKALKAPLHIQISTSEEIPASYNKAFRKLELIGTNFHHFSHLV